MKDVEINLFEMTADDVLADGFGTKKDDFYYNLNEEEKIEYDLHSDLLIQFEMDYGEEWFKNISIKKEFNNMLNRKIKEVFRNDKLQKIIKNINE